MASKVIRASGSPLLDNAVQGMHLRADEKMPKSLRAKGKCKEVAAALRRVEHRR